MRIALRVLLLLGAATGAAFYGWKVQHHFKEPVEPEPLPEAVLEEGWRWGVAQMRAQGLQQVGDASTRVLRSDRTPMSIDWLTTRFPFVAGRWTPSRAVLTFDLEPIELGPGECLGGLSRGGGQMLAPGLRLQSEDRRAATSHGYGSVALFQACIPPGGTARRLEASAVVEPLAHGDFVTEGDVRWAWFRGRVGEHEPLPLVGSTGAEWRSEYDAHEARLLEQTARDADLNPVRVAEVSDDAVLLVPHTLSAYEQLLGAFATVYRGKVANPSIVAAEIGEVPARQPETDAIAAHVAEHTVFPDGSRLEPHAPRANGRILAAIDVTALGGCVHVLLHREGDRAIPGLRVRSGGDSTRAPTGHRARYAHVLCPAEGFVRFVSEPSDDASYTIQVFARDSVGGP